MKEVKHDDKWENEPVEEEALESVDALSAEIAPGLSLIVQMRIYDVLMGIYRHLDLENANALYEFHVKGGVLSPEPFYDPDAATEG